MTLQPPYNLVETVPFTVQSAVSGVGHRCTGARAGHVRPVAGDPLRPGEILLGKALPGFLIGIVQGTVILSGFAIPIANMPKVVQAITLIDPLRYFLVILRKVFLEGAGFDTACISPRWLNPHSPVTPSACSLRA